jgi:hypothetical protein
MRRLLSLSFVLLAFTAVAQSQSFYVNYDDAGDAHIALDLISHWYIKQFSTGNLQQQSYSRSFDSGVIENPQYGRVRAAQSGSVALGSMSGYSSSFAHELFPPPGYYQNSSFAAAHLFLKYNDTFTAVGPSEQDGEFAIEMTLDCTVSIPEWLIYDSMQYNFVASYLLINESITCENSQWCGRIYGGAGWPERQTITRIIRLRSGDSAMIGQYLQLMDGVRANYAQEWGGGTSTIYLKNSYITVTPLTPGFSYTTASGHDYTVAPPPTGMPTNDIDGDGKSDIAVWRPEDGIWYALPSASPGTYTGAPWGLTSDKPVPGDYDGDRKSDIAVWRPESGIWFVLPSGSPGTYTATQWGASSDVPVPGDYDGDRSTDIAVWRPDAGIWYVLSSASPGTYTATQWGLNTDIPVSADYDGDGRADIAVWRASTGVWYLLPSNSPDTYTATQWGLPTDIPTPGDYDGDGKTDIAAWRPDTGIWFVLLSGSPGAYTSIQWGLQSDIPTSADYDGDGKCDIAVRRPDSGYWYILQSASPGTYTAIQWGVETDVAISPLTGILRSIP